MDEDYPDGENHDTIYTDIIYILSLSVVSSSMTAWDVNEEHYQPGTRPTAAPSPHGSQ